MNIVTDTSYNNYPNSNKSRVGNKTLNTQNTDKARTNAGTTTEKYGLKTNDDDTYLATTKYGEKQQPQPIIL